MNPTSRFYTPAKAQPAFTPFTYDRDARNARQEGAMALLRALNIIEIRFHLSGGGDSGDCEISTVIYADGHETPDVPPLPIGFTRIGSVECLNIFLEDLASNLPDGDWVNNEGGRGDVSIFPFETDEDFCFACDMTYGDDEEDIDEDDDDDDEAEIDHILRDIGITPRFGGIES